MLTNIPRFVWIGFKYGIRRSKQPFLASFKLTYRCNLRCQQCPFHCAEVPDPSFEKVCTTIDRLYLRGNRILIFEGGEPTIWHDGGYSISDVLRYARKRFFCVGMTTNGTNGFDYPADVIWVSLDGFAETHNRLRGAPIFDRIIDEVKRSRNPKVLAHITINANNAEEIPPLIESIQPLFRGITLQFYYPYHGKDDLFLELDQRRILIERLIGLKRSGSPILNSTASLRALQTQRWDCAHWLMDNVEPNGEIRQGCYVTGRGIVDCSVCGFSPYTESSLAYKGVPGALKAGLQIFFSSSYWF